MPVDEDDRHLALVQAGEPDQRGEPGRRGGAGGEELDHRPVEDGHRPAQEHQAPQCPVRHVRQGDRHHEQRDQYRERGTRGHDCQDGQDGDEDAAPEYRQRQLHGAPPEQPPGHQERRPEGQHDTRRGGRPRVTEGGDRGQLQDAETERGRRHHGQEEAQPRHLDRVGGRGRGHRRVGGRALHDGLRRLGPGLVAGCAARPLSLRRGGHQRSTLPCTALVGPVAPEPPRAVYRPGVLRVPAIPATPDPYSRNSVRSAALTLSSSDAPAAVAPAASRAASRASPAL